MSDIENHEFTDKNIDGAGYGYFNLNNKGGQREGVSLDITTNERGEFTIVLLKKDVAALAKQFDMK